MSGTDKKSNKEVHQRDAFSRWVSSMKSGDAAPVADAPPAGERASDEPSMRKKLTAANNAVKTANPLRTGNPYIIRFTEEDAHITEEYRKLKSVILTMMQQKANQNIVMVTSSESGEGKSLTATNLALVLAQECDRTVLLIDADLRRPTLHTYMGFKPALGLADCIADGIDVGHALVRTAIPKLTFLSAGKRTSTPAELLSSERMKELMREIKDRYRDRFIILDTPPSLIFSETRVLSTYADGILFIVKEGVPAGSVRDALSTLKGSPVLGIVYNGVSPEQLNGRYKRYYHYYKQQQDGTKKKPVGQ